MEWKKIKELSEKRGNIVAEAKKLLDKPELTAEEKAKVTAMLNDADGLRDEVRQLERVQNMITELPGREDVKAETADKKDSSADLRSFCRDGIVSPALAQEKRDLGISGIGVVGVQDYAKQAIVVMKSFVGVLEAGATVEQTQTGNPYNKAVVNDTNNTGRLVGEGVQNTNKTDPAISVVEMGAYKFSSDNILVSIELLQDNAFNAEATILNVGSERIGRAFQGYSTTGTGSGQPQGVVTAASVGWTTASGQTSSLIYDDGIRLIHSVDPAYRASGKCRVMLNDSTLAAQRLIKDDQKRPIFMPAFGSEPDTLYGYPVVINNAMASIGAGNKVMAFGDFSKYHVRRVATPYVQRITELFAQYGQIGFLMFERMDGKLTDTTAVKTLAIAAS